MKLEFPLNASISITGTCNFNCIHCLAKDTRQCNGLKTEKIKRIIDELSDNGCVRFIITGGEPFLRKDIFKILDYAAKKGLNCHLNTNGSLVSKETAKKLADLNLAHIDVGVYAINKKLFTSFCQADSLLINKVDDGISNLINAGIKVQVMSCMTKLTKNECFEIIKHFSKKGVSFFTLSDIHPAGGAKYIFDKLSIPAQQYPKIISGLEELAKECKVEVDAYVPYFGGEEQELLKNQIFSRSGCSAGVSDINIWADGNVTACPYMYDSQFFMGNIMNNSVKKIWQKPNFQWFGEWTKKKDVCNNCEYVGVCKGGCPADTLFITSNLNNKDPRCPF